MRALDVVVCGALVMLIAFTAIAFGAVYPWAFKTMEVGTLVLAAICVWPQSMRKAGRGRAATGYLFPLILFLGFVVIQLIPFPPRILASFSPATTSLYGKVLPGWPERAPYADVAIASDPVSSTRKAYVLPTDKEVEQGAAIPFASANVVGAGTANSAIDPELARERDRIHWYGISLSPEFSLTSILKLSSYIAFFLIALGYRWGDEERNRRFVSAITISLVVLAFSLALLGLVNQAFWNGKILWVLTPEDWSAAAPPSVRASGPFVNPDDFANYLAMLFPLALVGASYGLLPRPTPIWHPSRLLCAIAVPTIALALAMTLSRAGWAAAGLGVVVVSILLALPLPVADSPLARWRWKPLVFGIGAMILVGTVALAIATPVWLVQGSDATAATALGPNLGLAGRIALWRSSLSMVRDFPWFGVGLGAWPAIFSHYRNAPWFPVFFREAHNDYLQLLAETGAVGIALALWLVIIVVLRFFRARRQAAIVDWPLFAALVAGVFAAGLHEAFDFCLQIPANALLFTLLLALALRIASRPADSSSVPSVAARILMPSIATLGCALALAATIANPALSYPYDIPAPTNGLEALRAVSAHPVRPESHQVLAKFIDPLTQMSNRLREFETSVWLDPIDPATRDAYARELFAARRPELALREIATSVANAPGGEHFYLNDRLIPFLSNPMVAAIQQGFERAMAANVPGALWGLSAFFAAQGRYLDQAHLLASRANGDQPDLLLLMGAGDAYYRAGDRSQAEQYYQRALKVFPQSSIPCEGLLDRVYGPAANLTQARAVVEECVENGNDPAPLYMSLLNFAQTAKDKPLTEICLRKLLANQPSVDSVLRLGEFYLNNQQPEQAVSMFRRATDMDPGAARAYYLLGRAEEADYRYSAADDAYSHAIALAPDKSEYRDTYQSFRGKMLHDASGNH